MCEPTAPERLCFGIWVFAEKKKFLPVQFSPTFFDRRPFTPMDGFLHPWNRFQNARLLVTRLFSSRPVLFPDSSRSFVKRSEPLQKLTELTQAFRGGKFSFRRHFAFLPQAFLLSRDSLSALTHVSKKIDPLMNSLPQELHHA
jgi:hypothetical protein